MTRVFLLGSLLSLLACTPLTAGGTAGGGSAGGGSVLGGGSAGGSVGGGTAGGSASGGGATGGGSGGIQVNSASVCLHVDLGTAATVSYAGNTTGLPNWVESPRLEWRAAGDDTLVFTAPAAGNYSFALTETTTTNQGLGVSIHDMAGRFYQCPAAPTGAMIDGIFESPNGMVPLTAGQRVIIFVSGAYWSMPSQEGPYTLTITRQ